MSAGRVPVAQNLGEEVINLFNDHHFTTEMAERVCDILLKNI
jgi:dTDP-4-amino-4,6-dideoxygalactose transaminase